MRPAPKPLFNESTTTQALSVATPASVSRRCLVVAADGQPSRSLLGFVRSHCEGAKGNGTSVDFHVVVPCHRRTVLVSDPALSSRSTRQQIKVHGREYNADVAQARLEGFIRLLSDLGNTTSGNVERGNFVRKVEHLASLGGFDEILVLTSKRVRRPFGRRRDLTATLRRACEIPVTAVAVIESEA